MDPAALQAEAAMLAARTSLERADYLFEVAHNPNRGPDVADLLHDIVFELLQGRPAAAA